MRGQATVAEIAAHMPAELKALRAKLMLEALCEALGVEETTCPACRGSGWLDEGSLAHCPLCIGFQEVPVRLADWFDDQMRAARSLSQRRAQRRGRTGVAVEPVDREPPGPGGKAVSERYGRLAEQAYHVFLPAHE